MNDTKARHRAEVEWACGPLALVVSLHAFERVNKTSHAATCSVARCSSTPSSFTFAAASLSYCKPALAMRRAACSRI